MASETEQRHRAGIAPPGARQVRPGDQAADRALSRLAWGEAPCIGILGKSGTGKTQAARQIVRRYLKLSNGIVVVVDDKELKPRYEGQCYRDPDEVARRPPKPEPRVIVFRGDPAQMVGVDHERAAAFQQQLAARGRPTLMVHDEQADAAKYGQWLAGKDSLLARQYVKGRVIGVGKLWLTQLPAYVPDEPWTQSGAILCFNVDDGTLARLKRNKWVNARLAETIRRLPDGNVPPAQRGYFVLLLPDCASDGFVYRF